MMSIPVIGHIEWQRRFDDAIKRRREAQYDGTREAADKDLKALGLTEGDILYWANRKPH